MKILANCTFFIFLLTITACNNQRKEKDSVQKERSIEEKRDSIKKEDESYKDAGIKSDDYYDNFESPFDTLIGCWTAIRKGNITITFSKDSTFEFYDYNDKSKEEELLTGRFELSNDVLTLFYDDRPKQRFKFKRDPEANNQYRITNTGGYYFIKSHC